MPKVTRPEWLPFTPALLIGLALLGQRLAQAPRPHLGSKADLAAPKRWLSCTSASGR